MKVIITKKRIAFSTPPPPFAMWGPQAALRYAALQGFDFSRPWRCGWSKHTNDFEIEHASMGEANLAPGPWYAAENIEKERMRAGEAERKRRRASVISVSFGGPEGGAGRTLTASSLGIPRRP